MFKNSELGPFLAVQAIDTKAMQEHYDTLLTQMLIPIAMVTDPNNEVFKVFSGDEEFNAKAVFISFYFHTPYLA